MLRQAQHEDLVFLTLSTTKGEEYKGTNNG